MNQQMKANVVVCVICHALNSMPVNQRTNHLRNLESSRHTGARAAAMHDLLHLFNVENCRLFIQERGTDGNLSIDLPSQALFELSPSELATVSWTLYEWLLYEANITIGGIPYPELLLGVEDAIPLR